MTLSDVLKVSGVLEVGPPLDTDAVRQDLPTARLIQFSEPLADDEFTALGELMRDFPDVELRAFGVHAPQALDFLRHFPCLRRLSLDQHLLTDVSALNGLLPDLESLGLGQTRKDLDLRPLRLRGLRRLRVEGHGRGLAELIGDNPGLRVLVLQRLPADRLLAEAELPDLDALNLTLGSVDGIGWVCRFPGLRNLALRMVRGIGDLDALTRLPELRWLLLDTLKNVERLPDLSGSRRLTRVDLDNLAGMRTDDALAGLAHAEGLEELSIVQSRLPVTALSALAGHPRLKRINLGLGSERRNRQASAVIDLSSPPVGVHTLLTAVY